VTEASSIPIGVILLAAGASSRMGQPKMLLPWAGTSVLGHLVAEWRKCGARQIAVVHAASDEKLDAELDRLRFSKADRISNPDPARGMFSSIECSARWAGWAPGLTHWVIVLGDQPHLQTGTLRELLRFAAAHPNQICQPGCKGRARHPVVLPASIFAALKNSESENLKQFLENRSDNRLLCEMSDPGLDLDLDRPADYQEALGLVRRRA
jgi:molybdenum cofactor cytidylyltransferase